MTLAEFEAAFNIEAHTAEGAVKCLVVAAYEWFGNKNPDGPKMYAMCLPKDQLDAHGLPSRGNGIWQDQWPKKAGKNGCAKCPIAASYLGGTPANHYKPNYATVIADDMNYKAVRTHTDTGAFELCCCGCLC